MKSISQQIGENVRTMRRLRGLNQTELADLTGVAQSTISLFESGKSSTTVDIFTRIAEALNVPPSALLPDGDLSAAERQILALVRQNSLEAARELLRLATQILDEVLAHP